MKIDKELLDKVIELSEKKFSEYKREKYGFWISSKEDLLEYVKELYPEKDIIFLNNIYDIKDKVKKSEKPWAYHYSLHLSWCIFFRILYRKLYFKIPPSEREDFFDVYRKVKILERIFNHVDGIIEDGDKVYLIETDVNFIKPGLDKWTI